MNARGLLDTFLVAGFAVDYLLTLLFIIIIIINHAGLERVKTAFFSSRATI